MTKKKMNGVNGQHRLHAVIKANVPVEMAVARGFDVEFDSPIDQGRGRSLWSFFARRLRRKQVAQDER